MNDSRVQVRVLDRQTGQMRKVSVPYSDIGLPDDALLRRLKLDPTTSELLRPGQESTETCTVSVFDLASGTLVLSTEVPRSQVTGLGDVRLLHSLGCDPAKHEAVVRGADDPAPEMTRNTSKTLIDAPKGARVGLLHLGAMGDVCDAIKMGAAIRAHVEPAWFALYIEQPRMGTLATFAQAFHHRGRPIFDAVLPWAGGLQYDVAVEAQRWGLLFDWRPYVGKVYQRGRVFFQLDDPLYNRVYDSPLQASVNALQHDARSVHELGLLTMGLPDVTMSDLRAVWDTPEAVVGLSPTYITMSNGSDRSVSQKPQTKELPHDLLAGVAGAIREQYPTLTIVQVGTLDDEPIPYCTSLLGETTLPGAAQVLHRSSLHICNEGGSARLAHMMGTRSVVIYGPTAPSLYGLPGNAAVCGVACEPCFWKAPEWMESCPNGWGRVCLTSLTPQDVIDKAIPMLEGLHAPAPDSVRP